ncbi:FG-GAP repeat domain-containing protein [Streptomyces sp. NPDC059247]|uniref:FG-GAP repeat domain-containing protein n=1 Tax=Streptomyces sp. NPDC059247 TaxID=3346790 RepID=UPI00368AE7F2
MSRSRRPRHRLALSVAVALAVSAVATGVLPTAPALAAPGTVAAAGQARQEVIPVPADSVVTGTGPSGFLTRGREDSGWVYRWTRYSNGMTTRLPDGTYIGNVGSDVVLRRDGSVQSLYDLATGAAPVVIDTAPLGAGNSFVRPVGTALLVEVPNGAGGTALHLVDRPGGTLRDREVTGLPADAQVLRVERDSPGTLTVLYRGTVDGVSGKRIAVVDLAALAVADDRATPAAAETGGWGTDVASSATHLTWTEKAADGTTTVVVARRGGDVVARVPVGTKGLVEVGLLGDDWVTYGVPGGVAATEPDPFHTLTARSLTTGRTVPLLDGFSRVVTESGDGRSLVQGGTLGQGQGIFRIAPGADGAPAVTPVASTGLPLAVGIAASDGLPVPTGFDFTRVGREGRVSLYWDVDRPSHIDVSVTHKASGKRWTATPYRLDRPGRVGMSWSGVFNNGSSAFLGDYTWKVTARPQNGIGPTAVRTGTLTLTGRPAPHDFSDSGVPDLLMRDSTGQVLNYDARQVLYLSAIGFRATPTVLATGWGAYDRVVAPGNLDASPYADIVTRDRAGVLWLHSGTGHALAPRKRIGGGWGTYRHLTGGSDLTGDGRSDLLAVDKAGDLYLYKGTGNASAPFAPRRKTGFGWGIYDRIAAVGNIAGGPAGDLVTRDSAGVLWLYLGKGDGTFAPRTKVGAGWDRFDDIVGVGDVDRDGRPDLVAQGKAGGSLDTVAFYEGTGDWRKPFGPRHAAYTPEDMGTGHATLF